MSGVSEKARVDALRTLGLPRGARAEEVRATYLRLARAFHPDVNPDGTERFRAIAAAYEIMRRHYRSLATKQPGQAAYDERWWQAFGHLV